METVYQNIKQLARELRKHGTPSEKILWKHLRNRKLAGVRFLRQHPICGYIADFYCPVLKLVIELEGSVHDEPEQRNFDRERFAEFRIRGFRVLRVRNEVVMADVQQVLDKVLSFRRL